MSRTTTAKRHCRRLASATTFEIEPLISLRSINVSRGTPPATAQTGSSGRGRGVASRTRYPSSRNSNKKSGSGSPFGLAQQTGLPPAPNRLRRATASSHCPTIFASDCSGWTPVLPGSAPSVLEIRSNASALATSSGRLARSSAATESSFLAAPSSDCTLSNVLCFSTLSCCA